MNVQRTKKALLHDIPLNIRYQVPCAKQNNGLIGLWVLPPVIPTTKRFDSQEKDPGTAFLLLFDYRTVVDWRRGKPIGNLLSQTPILIGLLVSQCPVNWLTLTLFAYLHSLMKHTRFAFKMKKGSICCYLLANPPGNSHPDDQTPVRLSGSQVNSLEQHLRGIGFSSCKRHPYIICCFEGSDQKHYSKLEQRLKALLNY